MIYESYNYYWLHGKWLTSRWNSEIAIISNSNKKKVAVTKPLTNLT